MQSGELVGRVAEIWRHPVQSMRGEMLASAAIDPAGLRGDRGYAVVDPESGERVSSAQGKPQWRPIVRLGAHYLSEPDGAAEAPAVEIAIPGKGSVRSDAPGLEDRLAEAIGRPVHFRRRTQAPCRYAHAPLHLLTTASLKAFHAHYPAEFVPARFRPNLFVDMGERSGFIENEWLGKRLAIGDAIVLRVTEHCLRCIMTVLEQGELPRNPAVLQTVTEANERRAGIYAEILSPGSAACGDPVRLLD